MPVDFKLYLITDRKQMKLPLPDAVRLALQGGARAIQLREKDLAPRALLDLAWDIRRLTSEFRAKLFINDRLDIAMAVGADGVHLGHLSMPPEAVRKVAGRTLLIGVSTHDLEEAKAAEKGGADFITYGPLYHTPSKSGMGNPVGCESVKIVKSNIALPVFGLGGIKGGNMGQVLSSGADGVSMISEIFSHEDIEAKTQEIIGLIGKYDNHA